MYANIFLHFQGENLQDQRMCRCWASVDTKAVCWEQVSILLLPQPSCRHTYLYNNVDPTCNSCFMKLSRYCPLVQCPQYIQVVANQKEGVTRVRVRNFLFSSSLFCSFCSCDGRECHLCKEWQERFALYERVNRFKFVLFTMLFPFWCPVQKIESLLIALLALCKRRDLLPSLFKKERWEQFALWKKRFALLLSKNEWFKQNTKERIPNPVENGWE